MEMLGVVLLCVFAAILCQGVHGASYLVSHLVEPLETTPPVLMDLRTVVQQDIDYRYTDQIKFLTALKSRKFKSCFITDYDPLWNPTDDDLKMFMATEKPTTMKSQTDFKELEDKAGDVIAVMCRRASVYWLAAVMPPLPPSGGQNRLLDQPLQPFPALPKQPSLDGPKNDNKFEPPMVNSGLDKLLEPPKIDDRNGFGNPFLTPPAINELLGKEELIEQLKIDKGDDGLLAPPLIPSATHGGFAEPPLMDKNLAPPPPRSPPQTAYQAPPLSRNGELAPPQVRNGNFAQPPLRNGDLAPPPLRNGDLAPPPLQTDDLAPPLRSDVDLAKSALTSDLVPPPLIDNTDDLAPPLRSDVDLAKSTLTSDLVPPPLIDNTDEVKRSLKTPPSLAQLLGLRRVAIKPEVRAMNPPPHSPELAPPLLKDTEQIAQPQSKSAEVPPTLAPPEPEFKTPGLKSL